MLAEQFAALTTGRLVQYVRTGVNDYGAPSYSTSGSTFAAYYEPSQRLVTDLTGKQVMTRGRIYVISTSASIDVDDQLFMNGSTSPLRPITVNAFNDLDGQHHLEIDI